MTTALLLKVIQFHKAHKVTYIQLTEGWYMYWKIYNKFVCLNIYILFKK